ncbi:hypothetical protein RyT2_02410 [Pseudolactococcus yaeyamensis]
MGSQQGVYINWENAKREPKYDKVVKIAKELQTTTDYLLGLTDEQELPWKKSTSEVYYQGNSYPVTVLLENIEQENMILFLSMLNEVNQEKVKNYIYDLTNEEDENRIISCIHGEDETLYGAVIDFGEA